MLCQGGKLLGKAEECGLTCRSYRSGTGKLEEADCQFYWYSVDKVDVNKPLLEFGGKTCLTPLLPSV
jgi:hypothetical protein